jgi:hypothetical protein
MESSHIPLNKWLLAFYLLSSSRKGISGLQLMRALDVTYKSAWFMAHRIRQAMRAGGVLMPKDDRQDLLQPVETCRTKQQDDPRSPLDSAGIFDHQKRPSCR